MAYKAFVSSTFIDLQKHRDHVIKALRKAGFFVDPMEDWTATSDEPKAFSQARLDGCDLCVLIVAFRRGYIPDGEIHSITHLEYSTARMRAIDILAFLLEEDAPWPRKYDETEKDPEVKRWREELQQQHGVGFFSLDPGSLDIASALTRWLAEKGTRTGATPYDYDLLLNLQPDLAVLERKCQTKNTGKALRELRETITLRLQTLAKRSGRNENGEPPMEVLRRLGADGVITTEALRSLEYALAVTSATLYDKEVERQEAISAVKEAAVGFNLINTSDSESPQFRIRVRPHAHFSFVLSIDGKELISGEEYLSKGAVLNGIGSVRRVTEMARPRSIQERTRKDGLHYFLLIGANGEILGRSAGFESKKAMEGALEAVIRFAPKAPIVMLK